MSKKWKALHKREFEEMQDPELREEENQLPKTEKLSRTQLEYREALRPSDSLTKSPSGRLAKYFSGENGIQGHVGTDNIIIDMW